MAEAKIEIVERLNHRGDMISASAGVFHLADPKKDAELEYEAALTIQSLVKALEMAEQFISNGIELGFIRMPDRDDPALETLPKIRSVLSKLRGSS